MKDSTVHLATKFIENYKTELSGLKHTVEKGFRDDKETEIIITLSHSEKTVVFYMYEDKLEYDQFVDGEEVNFDIGAQEVDYLIKWLKGDVCYAT